MLYVEWLRKVEAIYRERNSFKKIFILEFCFLPCKTGCFEIPFIIIEYSIKFEL